MFCAAMTLGVLIRYRSAEHLKKTKQKEPYQSITYKQIDISFLFFRTVLCGGRITMQRARQNKVERNKQTLCMKE
jgi:hypothetical protein